MIIFLGVSAPFIKDQEAISTVSNNVKSLILTQNENIQRQLSKNLPELMRFFVDAEDEIKKQLVGFENEQDLSLRRGRSFLIAGLCRGLGIKTLEQFKLFDFIHSISLIEGKKNVLQKECGMWLLYAIIENFPKVLEPYLEKILQIMLQFFNETNEQIRNLSQKAIKIVMQTVSAYGVKRVLPLLVSALQD